MKIFLVAALVTTLVVTSEGYKCDPNILAKIKALRAGNEIQDVIKANKETGKRVVVGMTKGYFPEDTRCIFTTWTDDGITSVRVPNTGCPAITVTKLTVDSETLVIPSTKDKRYLVFNEDDVDARYKCSDEGPEGEPEGLIIAPESTASTVKTSQVIQRAKDKLAELGIKIAVTLPTACP